MSEFQKAAEKAADSIVKFIMLDIQDNPKRFENVEATYAVKDVTRIEIEKYFSDLKATYAKLVELADSYNRSWELHQFGPSPEFTKEVSKTRQLAREPRIVAAIVVAGRI